MHQCELCRALLSEPRAKYCSAACRSRASWLRRVDDGQKWLALPPGRFSTSPELLLLPPEAQISAFLQRTLLENAPPRGVGYRVGTVGPQSQHIRWFPAGRQWSRAWFALAPFEPPWGPLKGKYAVLYVDGQGRVLDEPRFTIWIDQVDARIRFIDGDRGLTPRRLP